MPLPQAEYEALRAKGLTHTQVMKRMSSANREIVYKADVAAAKAYIAQPATTQDSQPTTYVNVNGDTKPDVRPAWDDRPDYGTVDPYSEIGGGFKPAPLPKPPVTTSRDIAKRYDIDRPYGTGYIDPATGKKEYEEGFGRHLAASMAYMDALDARTTPQGIEELGESFRPIGEAIGSVASKAWDVLGFMSIGSEERRAWQARMEFGTPATRGGFNPELEFQLATADKAAPAAILGTETLDEIQELTNKLKIPAGYPGRALVNGQWRSEENAGVYVKNTNTDEWEFVTTDKPSMFLATQWIAANEKMFDTAGFGLSGDFRAGFQLRNAPGRNKGDLQGYDPSEGQDNPLWEIIGRQPAMLDGTVDFLNQTYDLGIERDENGRLLGNIDWTSLYKHDPYLINTLEELGYITPPKGLYGVGVYQGGDSGGRGGSGGRGVGYASRSPQIQNRRSGIRLTSWRI